MHDPLATVVVSAREGHFLAEKSLISVLADASIPFELIYIDISSPAQVEKAIRAHADARHFRVLRYDSWIAPALARKLALTEIKTKYVAFVDNDIVVEPGSLQKLVTCAEETGAGIVLPLYLQGGGGQEPTIHMAAGDLSWSDGPGSSLLGESHRLHGVPIKQAVDLRRETVGYGEYHYLLCRMDLLSRPGAISDEILLLNEHIDLSLFARQQGMDVVVEPSARVMYMAFEPRLLMDVAFFRQRWDVEGCRKSLEAFARKWPIGNRATMIDPMMGYAPLRLREVDLCRPDAAAPDLAIPMGPQELAQARSALREQALQRGYTGDEVRALGQTCDFATLLFDGLYRPDGRPFLNHVIGTASALLRYALRLEIVQAGLLHAAFTHRPNWISEAEVSAILSKSGKSARAVENLIRAQPTARDILTRDGADLMSLNMLWAGAVSILAANDVDMRLSGEYRATGRPATLAPSALGRIGEVLHVFGIHGLAESARQPVGNAQAWPIFGVNAMQSSFRLDARNRKILPV